MYCPTCGNAVAEGLKYCNRCGASLWAGPEAPAAGLTGPAWAISLAMSLITLGGIAMLFVIALQVVRRGTDISPGAGIMMLSVLFVILVIDLILGRQLSRVIDIFRRQAEAGVRPRPAARPELEERQAGRLEAPREPFISVTENTTRTLDHVARERDTRPQSP